MRDQIEYIPELTADILNEMVAFMRPLDRRECCDDMGGDDAIVKHAIVTSFFQSSHAAAFKVNGEVCGVFGLRPLDRAGGIYMPWMLTTQAFGRHAVSLRREALRVLRLFDEIAKELRVVIPAFYPQARNWLRSLGFAISEPLSHRGRAFYFCTRKAKE